jgi:outer membrane protein TolC
MTKRFASSICLLALAGCATVGPKYAPPASNVSATFSNAIAPTQEPPAEFWKAFNDATLNQLIDEALKANHDVRIATANLREARANRQSIDVGSLPGIGASGSATRSVNPVTA